MRKLLCAMLLAPLAASAVELPAELQATLDKGERFELISVSPARVEKSAGAFNFHGWEVLGRTFVKDAALRKKLVATFKAGVEENPGIGSSCFRPRHGIRVTSKGRVTDFIICFECYQVQVYVDDRPLKAVLITRTPEPTFNEALKEAKLPLSTQ